MRRWWRSGPPRQRLRRRLLTYSAPVAVIIVVAVVKLASVGFAGNSAAADFAARDAAALRRDVAVLQQLNVVEPGRAYFAAGTLAVLEGRLSDAETQFVEALARTEPAQSCSTRVNLELVREALGDRAFAVFDGASAVRHYLDALTVVDEAPPGCLSDDTGTRLNEKIAAARTAPPPPPPAPPAPPAGAPPPPPPPAGSDPRTGDTTLRLNPGAGDPLDRLRQILQDAAAAQG